ncbi:MAG: DsbA family oxidoreductase [Pseudomonadota bacterium]
MVKLDILSDPICPWCYIGKTHLFRALQNKPDHPFEITWHPFQLNPDMPAEGMDRTAYLETKFGGREGALKAYAPVVQTFQDMGLEKVDLGAIKRTPNTLDAHRLIHWAGVEGRQTAVVHALFEAYFEQARDISDPEVLCDIADSKGMDAAVVAKLLATDADRQDIKNRDAQGREMGVTGVPTFIVANQHAVPGAQPPELWERVIDELTQTSET